MPIAKVAPPTRLAAGHTAIPSPSRHYHAGSVMRNGALD
jgi:hypothetical protein